VLGAWGCGVFRNDPRMVAEAFANHLLPERLWHGRFAHVTFSVFDSAPVTTTFAAFARALLNSSP
jgi:uncharacterized protein (TIGR02452 family)